MPSSARRASAPMSGRLRALEERHEAALRVGVDGHQLPAVLAEVVEHQGLVVERNRRHLVFPLGHGSHPTRAGRAPSTVRTMPTRTDQTPWRLGPRGQRWLDRLLVAGLLLLAVGHLLSEQ